MPEKPLPPIPLSRKRRDIKDGPDREPSCVPRHLRAKPACGTRREVASAVKYPKLRTGKAVVFNEGITIHDPRPQGKSAPLTAVAYNLFEIYLGREPFWW